MYFNEVSRYAYRRFFFRKLLVFTRFSDENGKYRIACRCRNYRRTGSCIWVNDKPHKYNRPICIKWSHPLLHIFISERETSFHCGASRKLGTGALTRTFVRNVPEIEDFYSECTGRTACKVRDSLIISVWHASGRSGQPIDRDGIYQMRLCELGKYVIFERKKTVFRSFS